MAYNDTPLPTDLISDSQPDIRENFQLLEDSQVVDEGSTEDGYYIRYENGWQICRGEDNITYDRNDRLRDNVSFPIDFIEDEPIYFKHQMSSGPDTTPSNEDVLHGFAAAIQSNRAASVALVTKGEDFEDGDSAEIVWLAIGRWE